MEIQINANRLWNSIHFKKKFQVYLIDIDFNLRKFVNGKFVEDSCVSTEIFNRILDKFIDVPHNEILCSTDGREYYFFRVQDGEDIEID